MKRRKSKRKHEPDVQPLGQNARPASQIAVEAEPQPPADAANPPEEQSSFETFEISGELQQEIENFTNSFHVERHPGTPIASAIASTGIERPAPRGALSSTAPPP